MGEKKPPSVTKTREVETVGRRTGQADMAEEGRQEAKGHLLACGNAGPRFNPQSENFGDQESPARTSSQRAAAICCTSQKNIGKQLRDSSIPAGVYLLSSEMLFLGNPWPLLFLNPSAQMQYLFTDILAQGY